MGETCRGSPSVLLLLLLLCTEFQGQTRRQTHAEEERKYRRARRRVLVSKQALRKAREELEQDKEKVLQACERGAV